MDFYELVMPQAPFVIGAYGIIWAALAVYVGMVASRVRKLEKELEVVEDAARRRADKA